MQALLSSIAVIVYDVDGAGEVCIDGETGRLVPAGDRAALEEAARWMLDHPDERRRMGERGRERCEHRVAARTMVTRLGEIYEDVLAGR